MPPQDISNVNVVYDPVSKQLKATWKQMTPGLVTITDNLNQSWIVSGDSATLSNPVSGSYSTLNINGKQYVFATVTVPNVVVQPKKKSIWTSWWMILIYVLVGLLIIGLIIWAVVPKKSKKVKEQIEIIPTTPIKRGVRE
jgi:hypothetical protein